MPRRTIVIVTARDEADRLGATLEAIAGAFPGARVVVADDGSRDPTAHVALQAGAELVRAIPARGKGGAATLAAERVMAQALEPDAPIVVLCDGDLGDSVAGLAVLAAVVERGEAAGRSAGLPESSCGRRSRASARCAATCCRWWCRSRTASGWRSE
jgi:glycosyltransferase involved in cell wall biosynthesis